MVTTVEENRDHYIMQIVYTLSYVMLLLYHKSCRVYYNQFLYKRKFDNGKHWKRLITKKFRLCLLNGKVNVFKYRKLHNPAFDLFGSNNQDNGKFYLYFYHYKQWIKTGSQLRRPPCRVPYIVFV